MSISPPSVTSDISSGPPTREGGAAARRSFVRWPARLAAALAFRFVNWCRDDGYWYLTSMAAHAIGLVCLAMISLAIPRAAITAPDKAPAFDEADVDQASAQALVDRFEVGETPLDPSDLSTELLSQTKALPIASQTAEILRQIGQVRGSRRRDLGRS